MPAGYAGIQRFGLMSRRQRITAIQFVVQYRMLADISLRGYLGMLALAAATALAGLIFGGAYRPERVRWYSRRRCVTWASAW